MIFVCLFTLVSDFSVPRNCILYSPAIDSCSAVSNSPIFSSIDFNGIVLNNSLLFTSKSHSYSRGAPVTSIYLERLSYCLATYPPLYDIFQSLNIITSAPPVLG